MGMVSLLLLSVAAFGQSATLTGRVAAADGEPLRAEVVVQGTGRRATTDAAGFYEVTLLPADTVEVVAFALGYVAARRDLRLRAGRNTLNFQLSELADSLDEVVIRRQRARTLGVRRLRAVENFGIYEAKKTEVIELDDITANVALNNARQVFAKVPGLNIWESDCAGLQLDIGARGLSPSRSSNFNTRQNGYDMSADALGYPESYYTPPMQAVERIEVVRGAASLQYGTQFGGMVNFVLHEGPEDQKFQFNSEQTVGGYGLFNSFNSVGGTVGRLNYYAYGQYKRGDCWRPNSGFEQYGAYGSLRYAASERLTLRFDYTHMYYQAQQAGGLTDVLFGRDPRQSLRDRNWFRVDWNLAALTLDYRFSARTQLNTRTFGLLSGRQALGNLERINVIDFGGNRTLIRDEFRNVGHETRLLHRYQLFGRPAVVLGGVRLYRGLTVRQQGDADSTDEPRFEYLNPADLEGSDYDFPSWNVAVFAEQIIDLTERFSLTPGVRFEHLRTDYDGTYKVRSFDFAGNVVAEQNIAEDSSVVRSLVLAGLGLSYKLGGGTELYANVSQNFRSITFSDLRIDNPNFRLDPNIGDERGYNADLGVRGAAAGVFNYDVSGFLLRYRDRIGFVQRVDTVAPFLDYRYKTNVGQSRHVGVEAFAEVDVWRWLGPPRADLSVAPFLNVSLTRAVYDESDEPGVAGNRVELVAPVMVRTGLTGRYRRWQATGQLSYVGRQFTDASNAETSTATAVNGPIPTYYVADVSVRYRYRFLTLTGSVTNLTDNRYFTRRAEGYPGPGIIPADARNFFLTVGVRW